MLESSPLSSRIGTNYAPTDEEIVQTTRLLSLPIARLTILKEDMDKALKVYEDLCARHNALSLQIDGYRALLSPARRLPVDIVQEIFFRCLPTQHNAVMSPREAPLLLTQICSGWRHIALSTPMLWASIHISTPLDSPQSVEQQSNMVREWMSRSGSCPLTISLHDLVGSLETNRWRKIMDSISNHSSQWKRISIATSSHYFEHIFALPSSAVPLLESISITILTPGSPHRLRPVVYPGGILDAPLLREISLKDVREYYSIFPLKWANLTKLSLEGISNNSSIYKTAKILRLCQRLLELRAEIITINNETGPLGAPIILPMLQRLSIYHDGIGIEEFVELLKVPRLEHLEFHTKLPSNGRYLLPLLPTHSGMLQTLIADFQILSREDFITCLRRCPHLTILSNKFGHTPGIDSGAARQLALINPIPVNRHFDDELLQLLCVPDSLTGCFLLPELEALECFSAASFSDAKLVEFIHLRQGGTLPNVGKMERIVAVFNRAQTTSVVEEVKQFIGEHFTVRLSYAPASNSRNVYFPYRGLPSQSSFILPQYQ